MNRVTSIPMGGAHLGSFGIADVVSLRVRVVAHRVGGLDEPKTRAANFSVDVSIVHQLFARENLKAQGLGDWEKGVQNSEPGETFHIITIAGFGVEAKGVNRPRR